MKNKNSKILNNKKNKNLAIAFSVVVLSIFLPRLKSYDVLITIPCLFFIIENLNFKISKSFESLIKRKKFISIGKLFHEHWQIKKKLSSMITSNYLDNIYLKLMKHRSFTGGKIIGAGGGGFFLMSTKSKKESIKYIYNAY